MPTTTKYPEYKILVKPEKRTGQVKVQGSVQWTRNGASHQTTSMILNWSSGIWSLWFETGVRWQRSYLAYNLNIPAASQTAPIKQSFDSIDLYHIWVEGDQTDTWECGRYARGTLTVDIDWPNGKFSGSFKYRDPAPEETFAGDGSFDLQP